METATADAVGSSGNYFLRHWRGGYTLGISYWATGFVFTGSVAVVLNLAVQKMESGGVSLRSVAIASLIGTTLSLLLWLWATVGIWRSACFHVQRGGKRGWATVARVMVVLGAFSVATSLMTRIGPHMHEMLLIASGHDPMGKAEISVSADGQAVILHGSLGEGTAGRVERILREAPDATVLVLDSNGGRMLEGDLLARLVRERQLSTYVEGLCVSACTHVFLAGRERAATPNAQIGFHQPDAIGLDEAARRRLLEEAARMYRRAGVPEYFITRINRTPHQEMWYPSREELQVANVITRTALGGELILTSMRLESRQDLRNRLQLLPLWEAIRHRFPAEFERALDRAWQAYEQGQGDKEVLGSMRGLISEVFPLALNDAGDELLERYAQLFVDQLGAARKLGDEACGLLLDGRLDVVRSLPPELVEREQQLILSAMTATAAPSRTDDGQEFRRVVNQLGARMAPEYLAVVGDPEAHRTDHGLRCDAFISFYSAVLKLPQADRLIALRRMFRQG